ncbi:MAG: dihydroneopterin aldolase [Limisphaerales bacterium]
MSQITIADLGVFYRVGVPDEERVRPQRLLLTVVMEFDFSKAAASGDIAQTIDYYEVAQRLLKFGEGRQWKLIESLATELADLILADFPVESVSVEVKKFILHEARYVSVSLTRERSH